MKLKSFTTDDQYEYRVNGDICCLRCGALIHKTALHNAWHESLSYLAAVHHSCGPNTESGGD